MPDVNKKVPSLQEFINRFSMPRYLDETRVDEETRQSQIQQWYQKIENRYYELYGQEKIQTLRSRKEGE